MTIDIFSAEVARLKSKFESGDKPNGKDFNDLITLFYDFYQDMIEGLTDVFAEQILEVDGRKVRVEELGTVTTNQSIDCSLSKMYTMTVGANITISLTNLPADGLSTTILLDMTDSGGRTLTWDAGLTNRWLSAEALETLTSGAKYLVSVTLNGSDLTKATIGYRGINIAE